MVNTLKLVVNESEAQSTYVETEVVEGTVKDFRLDKGQRPIGSGRNMGKRQSWFVITLSQITELKLVDGTTPNATEWSVRYPYAIWDEVRNESGVPLKDNKQWFEIAAPAFKEQGIILGGVDGNLEKLEGSTARFEYQTRQLSYQVAKKDEETGDPNNNYIVWETPPSAPGARDGIPIRIPATYSTPLPTKIVVFDPSEAVNQAAKLYKQNSGDEFKSIALEDELVQKVPSLYRSISLDEYDPKTFSL